MKGKTRGCIEWVNASNAVMNPGIGKVIFVGHVSKYIQRGGKQMLSYLNKQLTSKERKSVIRYMTQYKNLEAIIESRQMDLYPSHTVTYEEKPSQSTNSFHSEAETFAINSGEIDEYTHVKKRLDIAYRSIKPLQQLIWDERFVEGRTDANVHYGHDISKRTYYREKNELICVVAECLGFGTK